MSWKKSALLRAITLTAVLTALAVVIKCFTKIVLTIPGIGVQVSFGGIFTFFPAALFGPIFGAVSSALTDFLGAMIAPTGAYIPWLTVTAFIGGGLKGLIWLAFKKGVGKKFVAVCLAVFVLAGALGAAFTISLNSDGVMHGALAVQNELPTKDKVEQMAEGGELSFLSGVAVSMAKYNKNTEKNPDNYRKYLAGYLNLMTFGLELFALAGICVVAAAFAISKFRKKKSDNQLFLRVLAAVLGSGLVVTTINTYILSVFIDAYAGRSLFILWVPRVCEEIVVCVIQAMIITLLCGALEKTPFGKKYFVQKDPTDKSEETEETNEKI
ncbi:MAG: ECF transporter S component [Clostridia bacterium]|nr:ECF transporter S component [Clostridia bacterium]